MMYGAEFPFGEPETMRSRSRAHSGAVGGIQDVLGLKIKNPLRLPSFLDQRRFPVSQILAQQAADFEFRKQSPQAEYKLSLNLQS